MGLPLPTRWSIQIPKGQYRDHLVGQLTRQFMAVGKRMKILRDKKKGEIRRKIEIKAIGGSTSVSPHHSTQSSSGK